MAGSSIPQRTVLGVRAAAGDRFASQEYHLVLVNTPDAGKSYPMGDALRIGKAPENDVVIEHPTVSRNHLVVRRQGEQFLVQDLGSTNGTFIDGAQVREAFLRAGSLLEVGDVQLRFQPRVKALDISPTEHDRLGDLVGTSLPMRQIFALIQRIAPTDSTLLLIGEQAAMAASGDFLRAARAAVAAEPAGVPGSDEPGGGDADPAAGERAVFHRGPEGAVRLVEQLPDGSDRLLQP